MWCCNSYESVSPKKTYKFGDFEDTYDWVECTSSSFPGKVYYYNLRSACATWIRPVSNRIQLQRYHRISDIKYNLIYNTEEEEDSTCYRDNVSATVAGTSNKNLSKNKRSDRSTNFQRKKAEFLIPPRKVKTTKQKKKQKVLSEQRVIEVKPKIPPKIIFVMDGIKTISYDPVVPELPPGVKVSHLSDSSVTNSVFDVGTNRHSFSKYLKLSYGDLNIKQPLLSEFNSRTSCTSCTSSTSCTSCTTCTCTSCTSCSSSTSETSTSSNNLTSTTK